MDEDVLMECSECETKDLLIFHHWTQCHCNGLCYCIRPCYSMDYNNHMDSRLG